MISPVEEAEFVVQLLDLPFRAFEFHGYVGNRHSVEVTFPDELMERAEQFGIQRSLLMSGEAPS